jgi:hypothetical protein
MDILVAILFGVGIAVAVGLSIITLVATIIDSTSTSKPTLSYIKIAGQVKYLEAVSVRKAIPAHIQAEIDQTPEWWDAMFHAALVASGASVKIDSGYEPEYIEQKSWDGSVVFYESSIAPTWVEGCFCRTCVQGQRQSTYGAKGDVTLFNYGRAIERQRIMEEELKELKELKEDYWADPAPAHWYC